MARSTKESNVMSPSYLHQLSSIYIYHIRKFSYAVGVRTVIKIEFVIIRGTDGMVRFPAGSQHQYVERELAHDDHYLSILSLKHWNRARQSSL